MEPTKEQLAELKRVELEMLRVFVEVCSKLNLRYYLVEGTLLGAVRHQGFIPWDDDIDVAMPREDYEIFLQKGQTMMPQNLFVQSIFSDPEYLMCFAKIRNSDTTFVETSVAHLNINHGAYIDIFPLDYYPAHRAQQMWFDIRNRFYSRRIASMFKGAKPGSLKTKSITAILKVLFPSVKAVVSKREEMYRAVQKSAYLTNYGSAWGKKEIMPVEWYGEGTDVMFEGMPVKAPVQYKNFLTNVYGDYMQLPPTEKRVGHHYVDIIDLSKPYTEYMK